MIQKNFDFDGNNRKISRLQSASITDCNFTSENASNALPYSVSVNLDWLHFQAECGLPEPVEGQNIYWMNNDIALEYQNSGTPVYKHKYKIIRAGEPAGTIMTHSRNLKMIKGNRVKIEIDNHVLYSSEWLNIVNEICYVLKATPTVYGRIDIAVDGCNHIPLFLNKFLFQQKKQQKHIDMASGLVSRPYNNRVEMKGRADIKPQLYNKHTGHFDYFRIGSASKKLVVYNKTKELERSHKEYIRQTWEKCGVDTTVDTYRCELRLDSQALATIKDFDINKLIDPYYLLQIFKTQIKNFFEFVKMQNDSNVTRAKEIDLFQFKKLKVTLLDKIPRAIVYGAYKAKMAIHNAAKNILLNFYPKDRIIHAFNHIKNEIDLYDLQRYYLKRLPQWIESYQPFNEKSSNKKKLLQLA